MAFSDETVTDAWDRADGKCECKRLLHDHNGVCGKQLSWGNRGREGRGAWEAHHRTSVASGGGNTLSNCQILCWDCHKQTI